MNARRLTTKIVSWINAMYRTLGSAPGGYRNIVFCGQALLEFESNWNRRKTCVARKLPLGCLHGAGGTLFFPFGTGVCARLVVYYG